MSTTSLATPIPLALSDGYMHPQYQRNRELINALKSLSNDSLETVHTGVQPWNSLRTFPRFLYQSLRFAFSGAVPNVEAVFVLLPDFASVWALRLHRRIKGMHFRLIYDPFISQYDTYVFNKELPWRPFQKSLLKLADRMAFGSADVLLIDTDKHADYLSDLLHISRDKFRKVLVGFRRDVFMAPEAPPESFWRATPLRVLWYGKPSGVHALEAVLEAIPQTVPQLSFTLVSPRARCPMDKIAALQSKGRLQFVEVPAERDLTIEAIRDHIQAHHIVLGGFGTTQKAASVVMNKEYEAMAMRRLLVTRDGPREFLRNGQNCIQVPPGDSNALAKSLNQLAASRSLMGPLAEAGYQAVTQAFPVGYTCQRLSEILSESASDRP